MTNVHVTDIGADFVRVTWDSLAPAGGGNHVVKYEARCVNVDAGRSLDSNHTSSSSLSSSLSVLTSRTNATFLKLEVGAKYLIKVYLVFLVLHFGFHTVYIVNT